MGLMSSLWNSVAGPSEVEEATIDTICATILFDDELSDNEISFAVGFVGVMMQVNEEEAGTLIDHGFKRVRGHDADTIIASIAARLVDTEQRHFTYLAAVGASRVEGEVFSWGEEDFLHALADGLALSQDEISQLQAKAEQFM